MNQSNTVDQDALDILLNTLVDDLKPSATNDVTPPTRDNLVEIKYIGHPVDYHYNLQQALDKAKTSKDYQVYQFNGATKRLVSSNDGVSTVPGNKPHLKRKYG